MRRAAPAGIGLAIIGAGRIGGFRAEIAAQHPQVQWLGIAETRPERASEVAERLQVDFVTADYRELLARPEVTAAIVATDEPLHVAPVLAALERKIPLLIEKPLATQLSGSEQVLASINASGVDVVVGYTQRFRRRWLTVKDRIQSGAIGDVTLVSSRSFMNRLVAIEKLKNAQQPESITPMVIAGTHSLDLVLWFLAGKTPRQVYARSIHTVLGPDYGGTDATVGMIAMDDGTIYNLAISWALPVSWPGAVDSTQLGIVGTTGAITVDDTHSDVILAVSDARGEGYAPGKGRLVDFLGGYLAGDVALGELRGPLREETFSWLNRLSLGLPTLHATAQEAHDRLSLTKALDLSARLRRPVDLPLSAANYPEPL